jgi:hypothetical protein
MLNLGQNWIFSGALVGCRPFLPSIPYAAAADAAPLVEILRGRWAPQLYLWLGHVGRGRTPGFSPNGAF